MEHEVEAEEEEETHMEVLDLGDAHSADSRIEATNADIVGNAGQLTIMLMNAQHL